MPENTNPRAKSFESIAERVEDKPRWYVRRLTIALYREYKREGFTARPLID
jgi:hypothetical protein